MHAPEPWEIGEEHESMCQIWSADRKIVAVARGGTFRLPETPECSPHEIAERIVACVNVLAGFSTERLNILLADRDRLGNARSSIEDAIMAAAGECG